MKTGENFWKRFEEAEELSLISILLSMGVSPALIVGLRKSPVFKEFAAILNGARPRGDYWKRRFWIAISNFLRTGTGAERLRVLGKEIVSQLVGQVRESAWKTSLAFTLLTIGGVVLPAMLRVTSALGLSLNEMLVFGALFPVIDLLILRLLDPAKKISVLVLASGLAFASPLAGLAMPLLAFILYPAMRRSREEKRLSQSMPDVLLFVSSLPAVHNITVVFKHLRELPTMKKIADEILLKIRRGVDEEKALLSIDGPLEWRIFQSLLLVVFKTGERTAEILRIAGEELSDILRTINEEKKRISREHYQMVLSLLLAGPVIRMAEGVIHLPLSVPLLFYLCFSALLFGNAADDGEERFYQTLLLSLSPFLYVIGRV